MNMFVYIFGVVRIFVLLFNLFPADNFFSYNCINIFPVLHCFSVTKILYSQNIYIYMNAHKNCKISSRNRHFLALNIYDLTNIIFYHKKIFLTSVIRQTFHSIQGNKD